MKFIYLLLQSVQYHTKARARQRIVIFFLLIEFFLISSHLLLCVQSEQMLLFGLCVLFICLEVIHIALQPLQPVPQTKMYT